MYYPRGQQQPQQQQQQQQQQQRLQFDLCLSNQRLTSL